MEAKIESFLDKSEKRQALIDRLDEILKKTSFHNEIVKQADHLTNQYDVQPRELVEPLTEFVFNNMPENAKQEFTKEVAKFIETEMKTRNI